MTDALDGPACRTPRSAVAGGCATPVARQHPTVSLRAASAPPPVQKCSRTARITSSCPFGDVLFEHIAEAVPEPAGQGTGPGVYWLVTGQDGAKRVVVMTTEGMVKPPILWALMDALQRVTSRAEFPADCFPDAQARLLA